MKTELTARRVEALFQAPREKAQEDHFDPKTPGLALRLSPSRASWVFRYRVQTTRRRVTLGYYEGMNRGMSLKAARDAAAKLRLEVRDGRDPAAEEKAARAKAATPTLSDLLNRYAAEEAPHRGRGASGAKTWISGEAPRRIRHVFSSLLALPLEDLTGPALQNAVDDHPSRFSAGAAVRYVKPVLKWAAKKGLVSMEAALWLEQPKNSHKPRERCLTREEIGRIIAASRHAGAYGAAMRFLFFTACRKNEICRARWSDLDITKDVWRLTISDTKQGRPHTVPLPQQAREELERLRVLSPTPDALLFPSEAGTPLQNWDRATKRIQAASETEGWHRHDIRRSVATLMGDLGVSRDTVEIALGHALSSSFGAMSATYNQSRDEERHTEALQKLADELEKLETAHD